MFFIDTNNKIKKIGDHYKFTNRKYVAPVMNMFYGKINYDVHECP